MDVQQSCKIIFVAFVEKQKQWDQLNSQCLEFASNIVNNTIKFQYLRKPKNWGVFADDDGLQQLVQLKLQDTTAENTERFMEAFASMEAIVSEMNSLSESFETGYNDVASKLGYSNVNNKPVGETMSLRDLADVFQATVALFNKEILLKKAILRDLLRNNNRDTLLLYLASWQMQPYLEPCSSDATLTSLRTVLECELLPQTT